MVRGVHTGTGVLSEVPRSATSASSGKLLEMQILRPCPRWAESGSVGEGAAVRVLTGLAGDPDSVHV